jgi:hypothetical protein
MAQKDLLENECLEEILREKTTYYSIRKKHRDFWLSISPTFISHPIFFQSLKSTNFYKLKKPLFSPYLIENQRPFFASLISLDKEFINWIQLRLGYFENIDDIQFDQNNQRQSFVSNGIKGTLHIAKQEIINNPLNYSENYLHPDLFLKQNTKFLKLYYKTIESETFSLVNS